MKIKVLHIIKSLGRGGAEMLLPETLRLHNKKEFEFHYIYFLPWKDQMVEDIRQGGGVVTCMSAKNNIQLLLKVKSVKKYIQQNNIQLVHAHLPWAGFLARLINKATGIPTIYTEHNKQERYHNITFWLNKKTFGLQNQVIAVSKDVEDSIRKNINVEKTEVCTILNGVNTQKFVRDEIKGSEIRKENNIPLEAIVAGIVSVFRFQKRLIEWLKAFKKASDNNPKLFGVMVGDGPLKDEIIAERKKLGLEHKVIMPGLQTDTVAWYSAMDIFMMSSIYEGLPIALLEAMSMKCAIVSTDAGGIKEVVENSKSGLLVPVDEWEKLTDILTQTSNSKDLLKLGEAARVRVEEKFSLQSMVDQLEILYKKWA